MKKYVTYNFVVGKHFFFFEIDVDNVEKKMKTNNVSFSWRVNKTKKKHAFFS